MRWLRYFRRHARIDNHTHLLRMRNFGWCQNRLLIIFHEERLDQNQTWLIFAIALCFITVIKFWIFCWFVERNVRFQSFHLFYFWFHVDGLVPVSRHFHLLTAYFETLIFLFRFRCFFNFFLCSFWFALTKVNDRRLQILSQGDHYFEARAAETLFNVILYSFGIWQGLGHLASLSCLVCSQNVRKGVF